MISALLRSVDCGTLEVQVEDIVRHFDSVKMPARRWVPALQSKQRAGELGIFLESVTAPAKLESHLADSTSKPTHQGADKSTHQLEDGDDRETPSTHAQPVHAPQSTANVTSQAATGHEDADPQLGPTGGIDSRGPAPARATGLDEQATPSLAAAPSTLNQMGDIGTPSRLVASPFQTLKTRSRVKQQAAGGVLAATLLAGQQLYEVKQSHILRPGVPRNVVLTIGSQAVTLIQSVKTMKPLESYPLQQIKMSFHHDEARFTFRLRSQVSVPSAVCQTLLFKHFLVGIQLAGFCATSLVV